jgi:hypothetical protein
MMPNEQSRQESVRARVYDPALRWQHLMDRIAWAEEHVVHRATPAACVREQWLKWDAPPALPASDRKP